MKVKSCPSNGSEENGDILAMLIKVFEILTPQEVQERMKLVSNPNQSTSGSENSDGTVTLQ